MNFINEAAKLYKETAKELYNLANTVEKQGRKAADAAYRTAKKAATLPQARISRYCFSTPASTQCSRTAPHTRCTKEAIPSPHAQ